MYRIIRIGMVAVVSVAGLSGLFGTSTSSAAPAYAGHTYGDAAQKIKDKGATPVIATVVGSQLPTDECFVTNSYPSITLNSSGRKAHGGSWMFDLNCNNPVAEPGKPGNSITSVAGGKAKLLTGYIAVFNKHPEKCSDPAWCLQICDLYGGCTPELEDYLASNS